MKLNLATKIRTEQLEAILASTGIPTAGLIDGVIYSPIMQVLISPTEDKSEALPVWELMQKLYAAKDGEVELNDAEVKLLKLKVKLIAFPWLQVRLTQVLDGAI
jgi:hypothetical protein